MPGDTLVLPAYVAFEERGYAEALEVFSKPFTPAGKKPPEVAFAAFPYAR
jgi:hypothetical protein